MYIFSRNTDWFLIGFTFGSPTVFSRSGEKNLQGAPDRLHQEYFHISNQYVNFRQYR